MVSPQDSLQDSLLWHHPDSPRVSLHSLQVNLLVRHQHSPLASRLWLLQVNLQVDLLANRRFSLRWHHLDSLRVSPLSLQVSPVHSHLLPHRVSLRLFRQGKTSLVYDLGVYSLYCYC